MSARFSDHLRALVPAKDADERAWSEAIERIAQLVLTRATWMIAGRAHRFTEVEFYVSTARHDDPFTHGDAMQREFARWYHHRSGSQFRGGTYKGIDLTFGRDDAFAGMLVRGIESIDAPSALLDGPCLCVDHLLSRTKHSSVASFVESYDRDVDERTGSPSYLMVSDERAIEVHRSARVGLTLKRGATAARTRFLAAPYRFLTEPARIKKGRVQLVCAMHARGERGETIAARTGSRAAVVQRYIEQFELGRTRDPAEFSGDLDSDALAQLLGACEKHSVGR